MTTIEDISYEVDGGVGLLTLDRPEKLNAATSEMLRHLLASISEADADDDVRAIIFTGAGRGYCAGADLGSGSGTFDARERGTASASDPELLRDGGGRVTLRLYDCKKPLIAAINGPAVGVGITQTLPMDIRLASDKAKMGFVFARRGLVPEACSSWFLPRIVGISKAMEWVATGRVFDANEALEGGLVTKVVAHEDLLDVARQLGKEIAENTSAVSVALARQLMWRMLGADHPMEAHKIDSRAIYFMGSSADAREGVTSFLEKRPPKFSLKVSTDMPDFYPWWPERKFE